MRALKRTREASSLAYGSPQSLLTQLSAATLELNPSLGRAEIAQRLTARTMEMLGARAVALSLKQGDQWRLAALSGPAQRWAALIQHQLGETLREQSLVPAHGLRFGSASNLLGRELAEALGWHEIALARLTESTGTVSGMLCLVDLGRELSSAEHQLVEALASHAAVALENVALFSRVERSRKQWVEDFDAISDWILVHDRDGRILRLNRAVADVMGVHPSEAVGKQIAALGLLGTAGRAGTCPFCRNAASTKSWRRATVAREESTHSDGDRTYLISTSRVASSDGEEPRTIHAIKDITDRREAERRFRRERDFNRNILNNTQSMILVLDTAGLVSYANRRCFEGGYTEQDLLGRALVELVPPARRASLVAALDRTLEGASVDNLEIPVFRHNGAAGQFSISLSPMRDDAGEINSIVVVMTDVTDAASIQAKLMHTEKMAALGQLVSGVAHEVNNPLATIVGFSDLLIENPAIPEEARQELRLILQEAQRTQGIVKSLLSFARQMPAQRAPVQVNLVLQQTLKLRAYDLSNHGVELAEHYASDLPLTVGDPHQLQQVFLNILNNAYDALEEVDYPGKIEIATSHSDGHVEIAFRDNGMGISQADRIFDPFFTTKEVGKGTGLGLSICYGIVRSHGGEIFARNHTDGPGCTFLVRLPVAACTAGTFGEVGT